MNWRVPGRGHGGTLRKPRDDEQERVSARPGFSEVTANALGRSIFAATGDSRNWMLMV